VDRASRQWIVLDREGMFWVVPANEEGWSQRQPYTPTDESELEPVPAHYRYMLGCRSRTVGKQAGGGDEVERVEEPRRPLSRAGRNESHRL